MVSHAWLCHNELWAWVEIWRERLLISLKIWKININVIKKNIPYPNALPTLLKTEKKKIAWTMKWQKAIGKIQCLQTIFFFFLILSYFNSCKRTLSFQTSPFWWTIFLANYYLVHLFSSWILYVDLDSPSFWKLCDAVQY